VVAACIGATARTANAAQAAMIERRLT
jgi:hypothetical protein